MQNQNLLFFLFQRPVAVLMSFLAVAILSVLAWRELPVSLLPDIDVPRLLIQLEYSGHAPAEIEESLLKTLRERMRTLKGVKEIESQAASESGQVKLFFDFGTDMSLAYIEANEQLDKLLNQFPKDLKRPRIVKVNTADVPLLRLQISPQNADNQTYMLEISELIDKVIRKRLESIEGISLIDANGQLSQQISILPNTDKMQSLGLENQHIQQAIRQANQKLASIAVKDGQYRYFLKTQPFLQKIEDIKNIPIIISGSFITSLNDIAEIKLKQQPPKGYHSYQNKPAFVLTIHKQAQARMQDIMPLLESALEELRDDYKGLDFHFTQNQYHLLTMAINNLSSSLLWGIIGVFTTLFLFMGNYRFPIIMAISLGLSLLLGFGLFYVFNISINIISLSGLALGLGMLIDNSIIVLDNMTRYRSEGHSLLISAERGVREVITPLISSMLTTLSVFVPLIFMSGLAGALFYDQALSITAVLLASLFVAFLCLPHLYLIAHRKKIKIAEGDKKKNKPPTYKIIETPAEKMSKETKVFQLMKRVYEGAYHKIWTQRKWVLPIFFLLIFSPLFWLSLLRVEGLPPLPKADVALDISWNLPFSVAENKQRIADFLQHFESDIEVVEADIGQQQYLLRQKNHSPTTAQLYLLFANEDKKEQLIADMTAYLRQKHPQAFFEFYAAPDVFSQLFASEKPLYEVRLRHNQRERTLEPDALQSLYANLPYQVQKGQNTALEPVVHLRIDVEKAALYGFSEQDIIQKLEEAFGRIDIASLESFGNVLPIRFGDADKRLDEIIDRLSVKVKTISENINPNTQNSENQFLDLPLRMFVSYEKSTNYQRLSADALGLYQNLYWESPLNEKERTHITAILDSMAMQMPLNWEWQGSFLDNRENIRELSFIGIIALGLLYFILSAQFESFLQPLIVVFTLPLGLAGSLSFLYFFDSSLNLMSAIGIIVMSGIMVNDAILKVDTINLLRREGMPTVDALHRAGLIRLKPILMTSITTIIAVLPVLFASGLGADLQKPLVYAVMGGLSVGTFTAIFFIPLMYKVLIFKSLPK
ncbi:MAG: efflux RND transporter permease subunit [Bernardetiaceae bacterium]|nr:efflux RND transporter permease subunit [Bernardetiaceae bacterium]